ncbi:hypothetical protein AB0I98_40730 [Streptomyces sp. NPDC050211]|uniref:hypothetical protein n=1 Tax=Streptomyces sp. NPDC050211 TaxID=3154932 RepID=UPI00341515F9
MALAERRRLHFVGSLPQFDDATSAFRWQQHELAGLVRRLSGGETGPRLQWIVPLIKALKDLPQIRTVQDGEWTGYDDMERLAVERGGRLMPGDIPMRLGVYAREELAALDALGTPASADLPLQIGVPGYLDMALFSFGPAGVLRHARAFRDATAEQIADVHRAAGDAVVFQLEVPAALIAVVSAPRPFRPLPARLMAHLVTRQVAKAPQGRRVARIRCLPGGVPPRCVGPCRRHEGSRRCPTKKSSLKQNGLQQSGSGLRLPAILSGWKRTAGRRGRAFSVVQGVGRGSGWRWLPFSHSSRAGSPPSGTDGQGSERTRARTRMRSGSPTS